MSKRKDEIKKIIEEYKAVLSNLEDVRLKLRQALLIARIDGNSYREIGLLFASKGRCLHPQTIKNMVDNGSLGGVLKPLKEKKKCSKK